VPRTVAVWESVSIEAAATAAAAVELALVIALLLGDAHVGKSDILDLENSLLCGYKLI
jgi:hypothetical protein